MLVNVRIAKSAAPAQWRDVSHAARAPGPRIDGGPGLTLRDDILPTLNLQVSEAAAPLGVDRTTLPKVLQGRAVTSPSLARRIEPWLGRDHGAAAELWLAQQAAYDLWQARQLVKAAKALSSFKTLKFHAARSPIGWTRKQYSPRGLFASKKIRPSRTAPKRFLN